MTDIVAALLYPALAFAAIMLSLFLFQSRLLYFPTREIVATPARIGLAFERVTVTTEDGVKLDGWFVPASDPRGVLLFLHGNAGNISHRLDSLALFHQLRLSTLIIDYRGFGRSGGRISEAGSYRDAAAALDYLVQERKVPLNRIIVFGRSLGGAIAAHLAAQSRPAGLIVESSFTSVPDLAAELYPFLPVRWLSRFSYDTKQALAAVECPVLIVHSTDDDIIPFRHGRELLAAANVPKHFLTIRGDHNQGFLLSRGTYLAGLEGFLERVVGQRD